MSLTVNSFEWTNWGNKQAILADIAFDSSYPAGGEAFDAHTLFGIQSGHIQACFAESPKGYQVNYDATNEKLKVFAPAPPIVYDETQMVGDDGSVTLDYPAAWITSVVLTGGQNMPMRSTGLTLATMSSGQCCLSSAMTAGVRTGLLCGVGTDPDLLASLNGGFTGDASSWTLGAGWAYDANDVHRSAAASTDLSHDSFAPIAGKKYKVSIGMTPSSFTAGTFTVTLGGTTSDVQTFGDDDYTVYLTAADTTGLVITPDADCVCEIDVVHITLMEVKVTYVTQAWKDVWENLVQDEAVTLSSAGTSNMAYTPIAVMYADRTSATAKALTLIDEDDTAATGEIAIYLGHSTAQIKATHADENAKAAKITYLKRPSTGFLYDRSFDNETATVAGGDPYTHTFDYPILLWGYGSQVPFNTGTTQVLIDYASTPAAGEAVIDWFTPGARGAGAPATGTVIGVKSNLGAGVTGAGVWGRVDEIVCQPLEVRNGQDLSTLSSVKLLIIAE